VKLEGTTPVPVDMLLILTSMYADGNQCYVETANIDGETNLKLKEAPSGVLAMCQGANGVPMQHMFDGRVEFEAPNKNIHNFIGALHLKNCDPISLSVENLLLRSSLFSNTDWGYGIAIYTGQETKIQMNNRHAPSKMSKIESYVNKAIIVIFISQIALVTAAVISLYAMGFNNEDKFPYVYPEGESRTSVLPLWLEQW
jgi:magnesium-transporting ATPase (P-type)